MDKDKDVDDPSGASDAGPVSDRTDPAPRREPLSISAGELPQRPHHEQIQSLVELNLLLQIQIASIERSFRTELDLQQNRPIIPPESVEEPDSNNPSSDSDSTRQSASSKNNNSNDTLRPVAVDESFLGFEKLSGRENYQNWRQLMLVCLRQLGVFDVVKPTDTLTPEQHALAYSCIALSISQEVVPFLPPASMANSASLAWALLEDLYGHPTLYDRVLVERRLSRPRQAGSRLSRLDIASIVSGTQFLHLTESSPEERDVRRFLASLPPEYDRIIEDLAPEQTSTIASAAHALLLLQDEMQSNSSDSDLETDPFPTAVTSSSATSSPGQLRIAKGKQPAF
ncbi:uncharacterized protein V1516DRAFT_684159 [Lipomyces oligophaga]|uniref:uncharacterized protein n=1 Tax=Lipomyces oligophaga TaxID=45792 RepID=UPI0034CEC3DF